jgi:hypothetical protein
MTRQSSAPSGANDPRPMAVGAAASPPAAFFLDIVTCKAKRLCEDIAIPLTVDYAHELLGAISGALTDHTVSVPTRIPGPIRALRLTSATRPFAEAYEDGVTVLVHPSSLTGDALHAPEHAVAVLHTKNGQGHWGLRLHGHPPYTTGFFNASLPLRVLLSAAADHEVPELFDQLAHADEVAAVAALEGSLFFDDRGPRIGRLLQPHQIVPLLNSTNSDVRIRAIVALRDLGLTTKP